MDSTFSPVALMNGRTDYAETRKRRQRWLSESRKSFAQPRKLFTLAELAAESRLFRDRTFLTFYDVVEDSFIHEGYPLLVDKLKHCTGYDFSEFTIKALNNDIHEERTVVYERDMAHVLRYNDIVYRLILNTDFPFEPFRDTYISKFRIWPKERHAPIRVQRESILAIADLTGKRMVQVDTWTVLQNEDDVKYVRVDFDCPDAGEILKKFYAENLRELGADLTSNDLKLLVQIARAADATTVAKRLDDSPLDTVRKAQQRLAQKLPHLLKPYSEDLKGRELLVEAARRFGLLPVPQPMLEPRLIPR